MIVLLILSGSILVYFALYGYLYLNVNRLKGKMPLRILSWLIFTFLLMILIIVGMATIEKKFPDYNKATAIIPVIIGFIVSVFRHWSLWKQIQNSNS